MKKLLFVALLFVAQSAEALVLCETRTFCPQTGRVVACGVYAEPIYGQRCYVENWYGYGVRCHGWDVFGNWVVYESYCPRW